MKKFNFLSIIFLFLIVSGVNATLYFYHDFNTDLDNLNNTAVWGNFSEFETSSNGTVNTTDGRVYINDSTGAEFGFRAIFTEQSTAETIYLKYEIELKDNGTNIFGAIIFDNCTTPYGRRDVGNCSAVNPGFWTPYASVYQIFSSGTIISSFPLNERFNITLRYNTTSNKFQAWKNGVIGSEANQVAEGGGFTNVVFQSGGGQQSIYMIDEMCVYDEESGDENSECIDLYNAINFPPTITNLNPSDLTVDSEPLISTFDVNDSNVDNVTCSLWVNSSQENSTTSTTPASLTLSDAGMISGTYSWYISCYDGEDYTNTTPRSFEMDLVTPTVTISYPANLYHLDGTSSYELKIEGTASDINGISSVWIDDSNFTNQGNSTDFNFQNTTGISDAEYTITIYANDTNGNIGNNTVTFTLDTVNPLVNIQGNNSFQADNTTTFDANDPFTFAYSIFDENINNVTAWISNGTDNLYSLDDDSPSPNNYLVSASLNISLWADGTYYAYIQGFNHIPGHDQQRDFQFDLCKTDWTCDGYMACNTSDQQACNSVLDLNGCGYNYTGDYSEFTLLSCNYCTPTWDTTISACTLHNQTTTYEYSNTCCADTGLPTDCTIPVNSSAECSPFTYDEEDISPVAMDGFSKLLIGLFTLVSLMGVVFVVWIIKYSPMMKNLKK